jgi:hypothetical protein
MITSFLKSFYQQPIFCFFGCKPIDHPLSLLHFDRAKRPGFGLPLPQKKSLNRLFRFRDFWMHNFFPTCCYLGKK